MGSLMDKPRCLAALQHSFGESPRYADDAMITLAAYSRVFYGETGQVSQVRREVRQYLDQCLVPDDAADDAILITSEFASNAIRHSASEGGFFIVRADVRSRYVVVEVEDLGGAWHCRLPDATHGLAIVAALVGPDGWGVETLSDGGRVVWARVSHA